MDFFYRKYRRDVPSRFYKIPARVYMIFSTWQKHLRILARPSTFNQKKMDTITILGLVAAAFITFANFPQTIKLIKSKQARDISALTYFLLVCGNGSWLAYGILKDDVPIIIGNSISLLLCATILVLKYTTKKKVA